MIDRESASFCSCCMKTPVFKPGFLLEYCFF